MQQVSKQKEVAAAVTNTTETRIDELSRANFDPVRELLPVNILDTTDVQKRTKNAERVAKHREKQANAGQISAVVPAKILAMVKVAGGWDAWVAAKEAVVVPTVNEAQVDPVKEVLVASAMEVKKPRVPEGVAPVNRKLSIQERELNHIAHKVQGLKGWRRKFVFMVIGL